MANVHCGCDDKKDLNRRDLLALSGKGLVLGAMGMSMPYLLKGREAFAITPENPFYDAVLTVFFRGGPSQTDSWDPKPGSSASYNPGQLGTIDLGVNDVYGEPFQVAASLPQLANAAMNDPMVGIGAIRSLWHGSNNHGNGQMMMGSWWRGQLGNSYPSVAPVFAHYFEGQGIGIPSVVIQGDNPNGVNDTRGARVPTALSVGTNNGAGGNPTVQALELPPGVDVARYDRRKTLLDCLNQRFLQSHPDGMALAYEKASEDAFAITRQGDAAQAFDLTGKQLLPADEDPERFTLAKELILAGVPYVTMGIGGNDTHGNNLSRMIRNWRDSFDSALAAAIPEIKNSGKRVLILAYGDFGRTPDGKGGGNVATRDGRDHWGDAFSIGMVSINQPKFKTTAIGDTGPDGAFTMNSTRRNGQPGQLVDPLEPKDLGGFVYRAMGIPLFAADGRSDIPTPLGRNAPPVLRDGNESTKLMQTFGLV